MRLLTLLLLLYPTGVMLCAEGALQFNRDVRPILSDKCFHCHGPEAAAKNIPLRLDVEADAKRDLGGRRAVVAGKPEASEMIRRVTADKVALRMPPAYSGLKLTETEIETLRNWIAQGSKWQKHWSFLPPERSPLPAVRKAGWVRNPIDSFVLARLERDGLAPSPEAARETLLRRVTLDLTGLPLTPAEVDAFVRDRSAGAYEKVVDRLLASPRYGERMAARWLDAARYADSNGYQYDGERMMWRWRDWVIDAFNRNQRFDQFTLEQIAGDMLPNATMEQKIATGFNRNHRANTEDGIIQEEYAVEYVVDRVETTGTVFLGLTIGCARCHNHKYDPFTQKEFYQLFAYFNNIPEMGRAMKYGNSPPIVPAPTQEQQAQLAEMESRIRAVEKTLAQHDADVDRLQRAWEGGLRTAELAYWAPSAGLEAAFTLDRPGAGKAIGGELTYRPGRIGQAAAFDGKTHLDFGDTAGFDIEDRFTISAWINAADVLDGPIVTRMADNSKGRGYGLHLNQGKVHAHITSNWDDDAIRMESERALEPGRWHHLLMTYTGSRMAEGVSVYVDGRRIAMKVENDTLYRPFRNAGRRFTEPFRIGGGWGAARRFRGLIHEVRMYGRVVNQQEIEALALGEPLNKMAHKPEAERTAIEKLHLRSYFLENQAAPEVREAWSRLTALKIEKEKLERSFPTVMVMAERPAPKDTFLLNRGAYDKPGEKVQPGVPAVLPTLPTGVPNNRLGFARWLVDPANPLTARVAVNRFWQMYFGTGLVKTTEDFGQQGEWPSHPELLDWLATEFVRTGWDVKAMQKLIVTSAAYRQSSKATPELMQRDPDNRLLARGPRFRLAAETIRDQALFAAGLLFEKLGGPSVKPYQPDGLWKEISMQDMDYNTSRGGDLYRRGLYTFWKRTIAPPMMMNFDSANRESCVVRETRTNTPLQALNLMNDVTFLEAARLVGERMLKEGGSDDAARLRHGFRLVMARAPSASEEQVLTDSLRFHRDYFAGNPSEVKSYLGHGDRRHDPALDGREVAAFASVASLILNLDEAVTKE